MHVYRGVFGSHVANVLRRLRRICRFYGSDPQFILASATIANPDELAERLVEAPVTVIGPERDGAPQGEKHVLFYNPPLLDPGAGHPPQQQPGSLRPGRAFPGARRADHRLRPGAADHGADSDLSARNESAGVSVHPHMRPTQRAASRITP